MNISSINQNYTQHISVTSSFSYFVCSYMSRKVTVRAKIVLKILIQRKVFADFNAVCFIAEQS